MSTRRSRRGLRPAGAALAAAALALSAGQVSPAVDPGVPPAHVLSWGKKGPGPGEFFSPIGIAIDARDRVFVADLNNSRVQQFTTEGAFVSSFPLPQDTPERKSCIAGGITVDDRGEIYVTFMVQHCIRVYDAAGTLLRQWGKKGAAPGDLHTPGGIVQTADGSFLVADQGNHRIVRFDRTGKHLGEWGGHGTAPGQFGGQEPPGSRFAGPHFITLDQRGRCYTTEGVSGRIQQFAPDGKPLLAWGDKGTGPGGFGEYKFGNLKNSFGPIGVFADRRGRVWVSSLNDRVQAFTPEGKYLTGLGGTGSGPGQFIHPHGMAVDSRGYFYVADSGNQRIQKFGPLPPVE